MTSDPVERYLLRAARTGRAARLRPMGTAEMIDLALRLYRNLGWTILKHSALPSLFSVAGFAFLLEYVFQNLFWSEHGANEYRQVTDAVTVFLVGLGVAVPLILLGIALITSFVAPLVADFLLGNVPNARAASQAQIRTAGRMLVVSIREGVLSLGGAILAGLCFLLAFILDKVTGQGDATAGLVVLLGWLALFPAFILPLVVASIHALAAPAAVLENLSARAAAKRSKTLMKTHNIHGSGYEAVWSVYGLLFLIALAVGSGSGFLSELINASGWLSGLGLGPLFPLLQTVLDLLPWFLIVWVCVPIWAATVTILYFERRVRLEGYDIETLAADVWRSDREGRFQL